MRNVFKQAEQGQKHLTPRRDLTIGEIKQIIDRSNTDNVDIFDLIATAFYFGVETGCRQATTKI
ncbi:MAG: hypothetical protein IJL20_03835 [Lachnospiraceae bacterium]|nr:hypothetical protein [Lachnospiraceae bacterium]